MLLDWYKTGTRLIQDWDKTSGTTKLYLDNSVSGGKGQREFFQCEMAQGYGDSGNKKNTV